MAWIDSIAPNGRAPDPRLGQRASNHPIYDFVQTVAGYAKQIMKNTLILQ